MPQNRRNFLQTTKLTACSTSQPIDFKNLIPILAQVGSSSTRKTCGFLEPHIGVDRSVPGPVVAGRLDMGAGAEMLASLDIVVLGVASFGIAKGILWMWSG
jgi:hypothetical protein